MVRYLIGMLARNTVERAIVFHALGSPDVREVLPEAIRSILPRTNASDVPPFQDPVIYKQIERLSVTSEKKLREGRRASWDARARGDQPRDLPALTINFLLTRSGYLKLGETPPDGEAFNAGMHNRPLLNDPAAESWQQPYHTIDALLILGHEGNQAATIEALRKVIRGHADLAFEDEAAAITIKTPATGTGRAVESHRTVEPFGFEDGISQPAFYVPDVDWIVSKVAPAHFDPSASLDLVLCPDRNGRARHSCGTYMVFRCGQHVAKLHEQLAAFASASGKTPAEAQLAIVGRSGQR